jgi:hypothetical protein
MATKRNLKQRLGLVNGNAEKPEPVLVVPSPDAAKSLAEAAESGFAAIQELFVDRNKSVELAQSLHRHNVYLMNINNSLRAEVIRSRTERDYYMKLNSRLTAWVAQAHDIIGRVYSEIGQNALNIETLEPIQGPTNNPAMPDINAVGIPYDEVADEAKTGGDSLPPVDAEQLRDLAERLRANGSV